jgi:urease accessory protein
VLRSRTDVQRAGLPVVREDTLLDPSGHRRLPGMLGDLRVVDTLLALGVAPPPAPPAGVTVFGLVDPTCSLLRHLGPDLAGSPLHAVWRQAQRTP